MKKIFVILICVALIAIIGGCSGFDSASPEPSKSISTSYSKCLKIKDAGIAGELRENALQLYLDAKNAKNLTNLVSAMDSFLRIPDFENALNCAREIYVLNPDQGTKSYSKIDQLKSDCN